MYIMPPKTARKAYILLPTTYNDNVVNKQTCDVRVRLATLLKCSNHRKTSNIHGTIFKILLIEIVVTTETKVTTITNSDI
jgi:hypothetical protein